MASLGTVTYDPGTLATVSTASLLAMTAFDTTNARLTFTAPSNGDVLVRIRAAGKGSTTKPSVLLGVLDGATVRGRQAALLSTGGQLGTTSNLIPYESVFLVTGLTPGNSYTWDAAYAIQLAVGSTTIGWGGANDTTANNAYGALVYEVWDTSNLLAGTMYDPAVAVSKATSAALALTALDTTNLRLSFTTAASGAGSTQVLVRLRCAGTGSTSFPSILLGVLDGATVRGRLAPVILPTNAANSTALVVYQSEFIVSGLTANTAFTWDAAYGVEGAVASSALAYGGPNDATGADAWGGFAYEIWKA